MTKAIAMLSPKKYNIAYNVFILSLEQIKKDLVVYLGTFWLLIESASFIVTKYGLDDSIVDITVFSGLVGFTPFMFYKLKRPVIEKSNNYLLKKAEAKFLLVDDHQLVRNGLESILVKEGYTIGASVGSGEEAINQVRNQDFDVILMDIMLPGISGLETAKWILDQKPTANILLLSMEMNLDLIRKALAVGVSGYVVKTEDETELLDAVKMISSGKKYFGQKVNSEIHHSLLDD